MTGMKSHAIALLGVGVLLAGCGDDAVDTPDATGTEDAPDDQGDDPADDPADDEDAASEDDSDDDAASDADEEFMTATLDGEDLDIARVSCRSGGENYSAAGTGDDLSVEFLFFTADDSNDPDPDALHSVSVFLGDRNGPMSDGELYGLTLAEDELAGFTSGGSVPAAAGTVDLDADEATQAEGSVTLDFDFSC